MNESDAFSLFQSLGNYLKTDIETSYGTVEKLRRHGVKVQEEGHSVNITVSNTAPVEPKWLLVVFTGVGIAFNPKRWNTSIIMKRSTSYKADLLNAPQGGGWDLLKDKQQFQKVDVEQYPMMTSDERKHGFSLYPGQSIVFETNIEPEDLKNIWVEGTLSRRHLFHFTKEVSV
ncbi:hypothetical protein ACFLVN_01125 [Chloroflexota bacterium]